MPHPCPNLACGAPRTAEVAIDGDRKSRRICQSRVTCRQISTVNSTRDRHVRKHMPPLFHSCRARQLSTMSPIGPRWRRRIRMRSASVPKGLAKVPIRPYPAARKSARCRLTNWRSDIPMATVSPSIAMPLQANIRSEIVATGCEIVQTSSPRSNRPSSFPIQGYGTEHRSPDRLGAATNASFATDGYGHSKLRNIRTKRQCRIRICKIARWQRAQTSRNQAPPASTRIVLLACFSTRTRKRASDYFAMRERETDKNRTTSRQRVFLRLTRRSATLQCAPQSADDS